MRLGGPPRSRIDSCPNDLSITFSGDVEMGDILRILPFTCTQPNLGLPVARQLSPGMAAPRALTTRLVAFS